MTIRNIAIYCFEVIFSYLYKINMISNIESLNTISCPIFVTWKTKFNELRGCLGTYNFNLVGNSILYFAAESAFNDTRFSPITISELNYIICQVSILYCFEKSTSYQDWEPGIHGLKLEFVFQHNTHNALFLPEVCVENGWSKSETIDHLLYKAGFPGPITEYHRHQIKLTRFKTLKISSDYQEFLHYWLNYIQNTISSDNRMLPFLISQTPYI